MNAKDKAKEIFNNINDKIISFEDVSLRGNGFEMTRQCALVAMDLVFYAITEDSTYWEEVKEEINKL